MKYSLITLNFGPSRVPLLQVLLKSWTQFKRDDIELVLVERGYAYYAKEAPKLGIRYLNFGEDNAYRRAECLNRGADIAQGKYLIFHDNDIPLPAGFFDSLDQATDAGNDYIINYKELRHLSEPVSRSVVNETERAEFGYHFLDTTPDRVRVFGEEGMAGASTTIERELFFSSGGFHEGMQGWGGEDQELHERLKVLTDGKFATLDLTLLHLYHPRTLPQDNPHWEKNCEILKKTLANPAQAIEDRCKGKAE